MKDVTVKPGKEFSSECENNLCSLKLPMLTLALWEQSLLKQSEIPGWEEFKTFLQVRQKNLNLL